MSLSEAVWRQGFQVAKVVYGGLQSARWASLMKRMFGQGYPDRDADDLMTHRERTGTLKPRLSPSSQPLKEPPCPYSDFTFGLQNCEKAILCHRCSSLALNYNSLGI